MLIENGNHNNIWVDILIGIVFFLGFGNIITYLHNSGKKIEPIDYESIIKDKDMTIEILERRIKQYQTLIDEKK
jgi:hypothetical protein